MPFCDKNAKKMQKYLCISKKSCTFAPAKVLKQKFINKQYISNT